MIMNKTAAGILLLTLMATGAACSSEPKASTSSPAPTAATTTAPQATAAAQTQDAINLKGYIAARIAQEKADFLFAEAKSKDGKLILNPVAADSKDKAVKFLTSYYDATMADKVATHYLTDQKADNAIVTNTQPFFPTNLLATKKEDITYDAANTKDQVSFTTKDGVTFTTKKVNDTFVLAEAVKK
ncbi:hypothetical protein GCM10008018_07060 [Paenibacillus marchantiophytorum]|uniref:Uncharacterized protein n=1 Tax=Paenibacillus marchantiophytorum TaxID=1619310 RepID=A0ABQ2BRG7_9BACL|nr:hypothetical protein [Paenibacillus marchantiophytorum]GGI44429.1 hypothetical protein GCM10008018_07060 [Paenibacillus marchantiophytorum]